MQKRLIVVSNRLPLTVESSEQGYLTRPSSGGLVSAVNAYLNTGGHEVFTEKIWLGMPGCSTEIWDSLALDNKAEAYNYLPVFISEETYDLYYNGFSNSVLWPLFHYFPSFAVYNAEYFEAYINANVKFCKVLAANLQKGDVVWIHDYHLLPLAGMLRKQFPELTIGVFLHIPFPSFELFRVIPKKWQKEILQGMLGADLVGFHTAEYVLHFLRSCELSLGAERDGQTIIWNNRRIKADAFPISIEYGIFNEALNSPEVKSLKSKYLTIKNTKKLLFSVDRLDYTKGINNRLEAYEKFFSLYPEFIGKVVFILVVVPSRDTIPKYSEEKKYIDEYIGNFNSRLGDISWQPIIYQYGHLEFDELLALYTACDLALITPIRDGMNLVAKEFIASRSDLQGVLVLSEMAGAAAELQEALLINPNDLNEMAEAIKLGLEMNPEEQKSRLIKMRRRISRYDVKAWAVDYFKELDTTILKEASRKTQYMGAEGIQELVSKFKRAQKKLMLIDYDGTLVPIQKDPTLAIPTEHLLKTLTQLSLLENNEVYIISGRDGDTLHQWLGEVPIGLVAEHGAKIREYNRDWVSKVSIEPEGWKDSIYGIMDKYVSKCPNSFIEIKEYSIAWHYRKSDTFLSNAKAAELFEELLTYTLPLALDVIHGKKVIEVRNNGVNKGKAVERKLEANEYDFILCIGDDKTDEDMFTVLEPLPYAYTIKVGNQPSTAKHHVDNPFLVLALLEKFL
ncbi:MAG: bifunctional alpha,alpha-trehalose-phosphate synthase (UDP-forming)/trehalose-phosphatase [Pedobacter sp.]|nr:MAG: bifunctional alpha,alpha-trehalose-phosphate synthase (UDP-forming)/trehalose-phosphatase [Pedobacter sp.]